MSTRDPFLLEFSDDEVLFLDEFNLLSLKAQGVVESGTLVVGLRMCLFVEDERGGVGRRVWLGRYQSGWKWGGYEDGRGKGRGKSLLAGRGNGSS